MMLFYVVVVVGGGGGGGWGGGGGPGQLSKNVTDHGWPTKKLNLHLLKHSKTVPKNEFWTRK